MRRTFLVPERLETERLYLRLPAAEDFPAYATMLADPDVNRHIGGADLADPASAFRALGWLMGHWQLRGYGPWLVIEKATGALIGRVGPFYPLDWPALEITWALGRPWWGMGYATEAAIAARAATLAALRPDRLVSVVALDNHASARLARRLGCTSCETRTIKQKPCIVFEHPLEPVARDNGFTA
jgi:RimJ/RimL family protein N-acetyltransferase